jgi:DNA-binding transcriptional LysR family regulator
MRESDPSAGSLYRWELEKDGRVVELGVRGQLATNNDELLLRAAQDGLGLAYVPEPAAALIKQRRLTVVLSDWAPTASFLSQARRSAPGDSDSRVFRIFFRPPCRPRAYSFVHRK